jgi:hypothetical protein
MSCDEKSMSLAESFPKRAFNKQWEAQEHIKMSRYARAYPRALYSKFWSQFYTVAKYGLDRLGVGAGKLFGREEAELALKHADACYTCASTLFNWIKRAR